MVLQAGRLQGFDEPRHLRRELGVEPDAWEVHEDAAEEIDDLVTRLVILVWPDRSDRGRSGQTIYG